MANNVRILPGRPTKNLSFLFPYSKYERTFPVKFHPVHGRKDTGSLSFAQLLLVHFSLKKEGLLLNQASQGSLGIHRLQAI